PRPHASAGASSLEGRPRCGFSFCRKPLPAEGGAGRSREYCREADTSWDVHGRQAGCRELGRAERALAAVTGSASSAAVDTATLAVTLDDATGPLRAALDPLTRVLE